MIIILRKTNDNSLCHNEDENCPYINNGEYHFWEQNSYHKYVDKYGLHFNEKLLNLAMMWKKKKKPSFKPWTTEEIKSALEKLNLTIPEDCNIYDFTFHANCERYHHDVGFALKSDEDIIKYSWEDLMSSYPGEVFLNFTTYLMAKPKYVDWELFV